jgi:sialic acid synthase SpsE
VTSYPAPEEEYNLRVLEGLRRIFGVSVGVSDHSEDPELVPALAVSLGANMVEKHFTLSREGGGLDDPIALEPGAFRRMSATIRRVEEILRIGGGDGPPRIREEFREAYGSQRVDAVLGDGVKRLAPSEARYYGRTNRSIHARAEIPSGHVIRHEDVALLRTEQNLTPGLPPEFLEEVIGTRVSRTIPAGEGVRLRDLACPGN